MSTARAAGVLCAVAALTPWAARADTAIWQYASSSVVNCAEPLPNGHVLIVEKDLGRVIELAPDFPDGGQVVWQVTGLNQPDRARRLPSGNTLIVDTSNYRVIEVDDAGQTVWSYGMSVAPVCVDDSLSSPGDADRLSSGDTVIADQGHSRLLQVSPAGVVTWRYGRSDCTSGSDAGELGQAFGVEGLDGGDVLEAEVYNSRVLRIRPAPSDGGTVLWQFTGLVTPARATALANGNVLISDMGNMRVIEVSPTPPVGGPIVWQYGVTGQDSIAPGYLSWPYDAHRLDNGDTLIAESTGKRVQLIAPDAGAASLAITSAPLDAEALRCVGPVDVELRDVTGAAAAARTPLTVALDDSARILTFFGGAGCAVAVTGVTVGMGQSTASVWVEAAGGGVTTLTAVAPWVRAANQVEHFVDVADAGDTDAGVADAGMPDSGVPDAPVGPFRLGAACGCATSPDAGALTWLILLAGAARGRRAAASRLEDL